MSDFSRVKRYLIVGALGNLIGWVIYNIIFLANPIEWNKATTSWVLSYLIVVAQQHDLHRRMTFQDSEQEYVSSLLNSYFAYSLGLIVSSSANLYFVSVLSLGIQVSWLFSVISSVIVNYFALKRIAFRLN